MTVVSVVIPALNAAGTIGATLDALERQDLGQPYEVIVVDNGSTDDTAEIARQAAGPVTVLTQSPQRPGAARNRGAAEASSPTLAFTDADCVPTPSWLRAGLAAMEKADLVQGAVRPDPRAPRDPFDRTVSVTRQVGLFETANLLVSRDLFFDVGGFEDWLATDINRPFGEDVWFGWRAQRAGARVEFCEQALVYHAVFPRSALRYVSERHRLAYFPALVARIPELRRELLYGRVFLGPKTAAFDGAALGVALASGASSAWPLLAAAPYAWLVARQSRPWGRRAPRVAAVELAADALGLASLAWGSIVRRAPVL